MKLLLTCVVLHWALANLWPAPWWLPDLTLAGMVAAIARSPQRWLAYSLVGAGTAILWVIRDAGLIFVSLVACGGVVRVCAEQWDLSDPRLKGALAGVSAAGLQGLALWQHGWWSWPLGFMWMAHAGLTGAATAVISGMVLGRRAAPSSVA